MIRQLVVSDFLALDIAGFGGLTIADKGRDLLRGAARFECRPPSRTKRAERKSRAAAAVEALPDTDATLLDALKQLRLILARERRVPAYAIFPDRTLIDMAARKPRTTNEFAEVHGVGAAKLNDFADTFLATIRNHQAA
jgi:ATP-dependent DNA helicase RecQ